MTAQIQLRPLSRLLPWVGDISAVPDDQLRRAALDLGNRQFASRTAGLAWLRAALDVDGPTGGRVPASPDAQQRALDRLGVPSEAYDFVAAYRVANFDLFVTSHGQQVSASSRVGVHADPATEAHRPRTRRTSFRSGPDPTVQAVLRDPTPATFDYTGLSPFAMRVFATVAGIPRGEVRGLDWLARSCACPGASTALIVETLTENPFPYVLPTHRLDGADVWPIMAGLQLDEVRSLRAFEGTADLTDSMSRGGRYVVRPDSRTVCEVGCRRARVGERGAYLIRDLSEAGTGYRRCAVCRPRSSAALPGTSDPGRSPVGQVR